MVDCDKDRGRRGPGKGEGGTLEKGKDKFFGPDGPPSKQSRSPYTGGTLYTGPQTDSSRSDTGNEVDQG